MISRLLLLAALLPLPLFAVPPAASTYVDTEGVLRWTASQAEVAQFGVNYTAPFAFAFRAHQRLGVPIERAIDSDVYHFSRLGFDAYRVHMWDREITDRQGNLLANERLRAFDYLMAQLKRRGIKSVLTPLQFGDAGYPEPGVPLPGFSSDYGKRGCLEDRTSWPAQQRYLAQLMDHVNPHTGLAYKDDPDVIGFEICNEPGHFDYEPTLAYINTMVRAIRGTGCAKPVFYNMSHGIPAHQAYLDAEVQGGTFQWYPTNLLAGHEQHGNFLPYVDDYPIPFADAPGFRRKAKIVYEFDAADTGQACLYPAMARTFRRAGFQVATQFAYDPLYLAPSNTEYQTHYLNLAYSPQKALAMKIAGEAFRRVRLHEDFGRYPQNVAFAGVRIDYEQDLAEYVDRTNFFHSSATTTRPPAPGELEHIAGYGNSPVVSSPGRGAHFLDRLEPGVWRLEVMPDAVRIADPFGKASPERQVVQIAWNTWPLTLELPDLGHDFAVTGLNDGNTFAAKANGAAVTVGPGAYLLVRSGASTRWKRDDAWANLVLKEFVAPPPSLERTLLEHQPPREASVGRDLELAFLAASPRPIHEAHLVALFPPDPAKLAERPTPNPRAQPGGGNAPAPALTFPAQSRGGGRYTVTLPAANLHAGVLQYHLVVADANGSRTYPSDLPRTPTNWAFTGEPWTTQLVAPDAPLLLFDAVRDTKDVTADHRQVTYELAPSDRPGILALSFVARDLASGEHDESWRFYFRQAIAGRTDRLGNARQLVLHGRSTSETPCRVQVALVSSEGVAYGATLDVPRAHGDHAIALSALKPVRLPNIPHGYPVFVPYWSPAPTSAAFDPTRAECVLVSIGPGIDPTDRERAHGLELERIWLE